VLSWGKGEGKGEVFDSEWMARRLLQC